MALDERLRRELEYAARPADPSGVYEDLIRRKERRRLVHRAEHAALAIAVVAGSAAGILGLAKVFQPDGQRPGSSDVRNGLIAFVESEQVETADGFPAMESTLWLANPDGSERRGILTISGSISGIDWSRTGTQLAFDADNAIYVVNVDGTGLQRLTGEDVFARNPSWSPDGSQIVYSMEPAEGRDGSEIAIMNVDGTGQRSLTDLGATSWPDWSPSGTEIVFVGPGPEGHRQGWDIYVMSADGTGIQNLTDSPTVDLDPDWSPDGDRIVFRSRRDVVTTRAGDQPDEVYVMNADGSQQTRLTNDTSTDQSPIWAPDGTTIAFTSFSEGTDGTQIVAIRPDGSDRRILMDDVAGITIAWLPILNDTAEVSLTDTPSPTPSATDDRLSVLAPGLELCDVTSVTGTFVGAYPNSEAFVGTVSRDGSCDVRGRDLESVVAIDLSGDEADVFASDPFPCEAGCSAYAAPDVDGDGNDEILVQNVQFSIAGVILFDVVPSEDTPGLVRVMVEPPGDAVLGFQGFDGSGPPQFWIGGDAFTADSLRCEASADGRVLVSVTAQQVPPDSPNSVWEVHETVFELDSGVLRVVEARDFSVPFDGGTPGFTGTGGCGADLGGP